MARTRVRTLLVEDSADDAAFVRESLAGADLTDFSLQSVDRLGAACKSLQADDFDVVLLDLGLPDAHGLQALLQIRELSPEIPVVVLTGNTDPSVGLEAVAHGAQDYLYKGDVSSRTLERVLRYALQRQQMLFQLQRANELLDQNNKRLSQLYETAHQFVDNVSHEFRTPLTVVKEYVTLVRDGLAGRITTQQRGFLDVANDRVDDLATMVDDMLDVSRLEAGLLSVWRRESKLAQIVDRIRPALQRKAAIKRVLLEITLDDDLPAIYCDSEKIGRVITNLVANAIKFSAETGYVRLWAKQNPEAAEILVGITDNGPGIDPDNLQLIFERFHQVQGLARSSTKGFGLGLGIAKELVTLNLGEINVESEPGRGATFSFSIPVCDPAELVIRYMHRLRMLQSGSGVAALIAISVPSPIETALSELVDELLQSLFRGDNLVIRCQPHYWLAVAECPRQEIDTMLDQIRGGFEESARNLPGKKLPQPSLRLQGMWQIETESEQLVERFRAELLRSTDRSRPPRVLVVDDDREMLRGLEIRLRASGFEVFTAADGRFGVEAALQHRPDAILVDDRSELDDGSHAFGRLADSAASMNIPLVMLSGDTQERKHGLELGETLLLSKPCDAGAVTAALHKVIADSDHRRR